MELFSGKFKEWIISSLERDVPVTMAYGFSYKMTFFPWEDSDKTNDGKTGGHYINVTELRIDNIAEEEYMKIASWGNPYRLDMESFLNFFGTGGWIYLHEGV